MEGNRFWEGEGIGEGALSSLECLEESGSKILEFPLENLTLEPQLRRPPKNQGEIAMEKITLDTDTD